MKVIMITFKKKLFLFMDRLKILEILHYRNWVFKKLIRVSFLLRLIRSWDWHLIFVLDKLKYKILKEINN